MKITLLHLSAVLVVITLTACAYSTKGDPGQPGKPGEPRPAEGARPEPSEDTAE